MKSLDTYVVLPELMPVGRTKYNNNMSIIYVGSWAFINHALESIPGSIFSHADENGTAQDSVIFTTCPVIKTNKKYLFFQRR